MINATNPGLDKAPEALNGVRVNVSDHIDVFAVIDSVMGISACAQAVVGTECVSEYNRLREYVFPDQSIERILCGVSKPCDR